MQNLIFNLVVVVTLSGTHLSIAEDLTPVPEEFIYCTVCHGTQLKGNAETEAPRLSGLQDWYVKNQLEAFRKGWRGNHPKDISGHEMRAAAEALTDELLVSAPIFVTSTYSPLPDKTIVGDVASGETIFQTCSICHGDKAQGNPQLAAPSLVGLNDWYIVQQLQNFKQGLRGVNTEDSIGRQMQNSIGLLKNDQAMIDVAAFITQILTQE